MLKTISLTTLGLSSLLFVSNTFATTGGPQEIEILGYEAVKEHKLYVLRYFVDESGRLPQLYYYAMDAKSPDKRVEVQSLYINPETHQKDLEQDSEKFESELAKIQKRLVPLIADDRNIAKIVILNTKTHQVKAPYDEHKKITQYTITYQVINNQYKSAIQTAVAYNPKLTISQNFIIPNQDKKIVVVKYFGIPVETGYSIEDPVVLLPKK